jgi:pyruvate kinase
MDRALGRANLRTSGMPLNATCWAKRSAGGNSPEEHSPPATGASVRAPFPGPKLRIGTVEKGACELRSGGRVVLTAEKVPGTSERLPVEWSGITSVVERGDAAYLADGAVRLRVIEVFEREVVAAVEVGGPVASRQGINLPDATVGLPAISQQDLECVDAGKRMGIDIVAVSFVRRREDLDPVKERLASHPYGDKVPVIAKIEKPEAAADAERIVDGADGVMVARGDIGVELPLEAVPLLQKQIIGLAGAQSKLSITATQMLESMVRERRPTRAEVADVANAIFDGTDA